MYGTGSWEEGIGEERERGGRYRRHWCVCTGVVREGQSDRSLPDLNHNTRMIHER